MDCLPCKYRQYLVPTIIAVLALGIAFSPLVTRSAVRRPTIPATTEVTPPVQAPAPVTESRTTRETTGVATEYAETPRTTVDTSRQPNIIVRASRAIYNFFTGTTEEPATTAPARESQEVRAQGIRR